jgi:hypothetical protein
VRRPFYHRWYFWVPVVLLVVFVGARLLVDPLATWATRRALDNLPGFRGTFDRVHVSVVPLRYRISKLKIFELPLRKGKAPILYARYVEAGMQWRDLLRGELAAVARVEDAKATILLQEEVTPKDIVAEKIKQKIPPPLRIDEALRKLFPFRINRLEVMDSEALVIDTESKGRPRLWVHDIEATVENFATRDKLTRGKPTTVAMRGKLQRSGDLTAYVSADLLANRITFAGQARIANLQLAELHEWVVAKSKDLSIPKGQFEAFTSFECENGQIKGGVKPILTNVDVEAQNGGLGAKLKEALADATVKLVSDRVPGREAVATLIPFEGSIQKPQVQPWPAIIATIRNSFVEGLSASFENLPPPEAKRREGVVTQARRGLSRESRPHTKAQPQGERK